jgi:hypothetical protein
MYVSRNIEVRSHKHCGSGKAVSITYCKRAFVTIVTQHAKCMHHVTLSTAACLALPHFSSIL